MFMSILYNDVGRRQAYGAWVRAGFNTSPSVIDRFSECDSAVQSDMRILFIVDAAAYPISNDTVRPDGAALATCSVTVQQKNRD